VDSLCVFLQAVVQAFRLTLLFWPSPPALLIYDFSQKGVFFPILTKDILNISFHLCVFSFHETSLGCFTLTRLRAHSLNGPSRPRRLVGLAGSNFELSLFPSRFQPLLLLPLKNLLWKCRFHRCELTFFIFFSSNRAGAFEVFPLPRMFFIFVEHPLRENTRRRFARVPHGFSLEFHFILYFLLPETFHGEIDHKKFIGLVPHDLLVNWLGVQIAVPLPPCSSPRRQSFFPSFRPRRARSGIVEPDPYTLTPGYRRLRDHSAGQSLRSLYSRHEIFPCPSRSSFLNIKCLL